MANHGDLILLTGATGHIGYRTLVEALEKGYSVLAAVRSQKSLDTIKAAPSVQKYQDKLSYAIIPDLTLPGAFDKVLANNPTIKYIVHVASPLAGSSPPDADFQKLYIEPAVNATTSILRSATKFKNIKRIVITASQESLHGANGPKTASGAVLVRPDFVVPDSELQGPFSSAFQAYAASKASAYNATLEFVKTEKPHFDVVNINPSFVFGKNELAVTEEAARSGTNAIVLAPILGVSPPSPMPGTSVHVDDVAGLHIRVLDPDLKVDPAKGYTTFAANSQWQTGVSFDDGKVIAQKYFPEVVEKGLLKNDGHIEVAKMEYDASSTEEVLGWKFKDYEEQVKSALGHYLEVASK